MSRARTLSIVVSLLFSACAQLEALPRPPPRPAPSSPSALAPRLSPVVAGSPLPFQAPPFDRIQDTDYQPAIEEGMRQQLAEVRAGRRVDGQLRRSIDAARDEARRDQRVEPREGGGRAARAPEL